MGLDQNSKVYMPSIAGHQPLRQGEILTNLVQAIANPETIFSETPTILPIIHPFIIVVTQDCDLDLDFKARNGGDARPHRLLTSILFCEASLAVNFKNNSPKDVVNSSRWKDYIEKNGDERFHFLQSISSEADALGEGIGELVVEFRRYFSMHPEEVYLRISKQQAKCRCVLASPYLEHFSSRFAYYQFRVALPEQHLSV